MYICDRPYYLTTYATSGKPWIAFKHESLVLHRWVITRGHCSSVIGLHSDVYSDFESYKDEHANQTGQKKKRKKQAGGILSPVPLSVLRAPA